MKSILLTMTAMVSVLITSGPILADDVPISGGVPDLSGKWKGTWKSETNDHSGPINAKLTRRNDGTYRAVFRGRFFVVIPFRYATTMQIIEENPQQVVLSASSNLGPLLGRFEATTIATAETFDSSFSAANDRGQFNLRRRR